MPNNLSIVILTKNSADTIDDTLKSIAWADEIIIIDEDSSDDTVKMAKPYQAKIYSETNPSFAYRRNIGLKKATNNWILYIDADEIITKSSQKEILEKITGSTDSNYEFIRTNYFLGTKMYPDKVQRLFYKKNLKKWSGKVHESPQFTGKLETLKFPLIHHTHRTITTMLDKTNQWSDVEAKLRLEANHPPVRVWRVIRIALTELYRQFGIKKVYKYGTAGWMEGLFQVIDKIIVYIKLWELQNT